MLNKERGGRMKISEYYKLGKTQYELDFVDIDVDADAPLFLDPYFIGKTEFPIAVEAKKSLSTFFDCLLQAVRDGREKDALKLLSHLGETNELCFGFSKGKPQGRGMGRSDAAKIYKSLEASEAVRTGIVEDIEDCRIFVDNVDKDKVSDMAANIIRKQLIEYTRAQCELLGIPLENDVSSGHFWDSDKKMWCIEYVKMPVINDKRILFVPKRLVSCIRDHAMPFRG